MVEARRDTGLDNGAESKVYPVCMALTISKLAAQVGVTADTIRFYERSGLLSAPERTASGYRVYAEEIVERVRFIRGGQHVGLRLREIRELLEVRDRGLCPCGHAETLVRHRLAELDDEIDQLAGMKGELVGLLERFPSAECPSDAGWPCEREFIRAGGGKVDGP
jgi:DNA-binding transcriptional MerR regulator